MSGPRFAEAEARLQPGDRLLLYTDGATERRPYPRRVLMPPAKNSSAVGTRSMGLRSPCPLPCGTSQPPRSETAILWASKQSPLALPPRMAFL